VPASGDAAAGGEGVFANADRDVVVTLVDAGLDDSAAETDVRALHDGRVLVLVTLGAVTEDRAREVLEV
jgi:hypothetical protein